MKNWWCWNGLLSRFNQGPYHMSFTESYKDIVLGRYYHNPLSFAVLPATTSVLTPRLASMCLPATLSWCTYFPRSLWSICFGEEGWRVPSPYLQLKNNLPQWVTDIGNIIVRVHPVTKSLTNLAALDICISISKIYTRKGLCGSPVGILQIVLT